jgi:hypothetical protein
VFSSATVNQVEVHIDGVFQGFASKVDQLLYVLAWNPSLYSRGIHTIQVKASVRFKLLSYVVNVTFFRSKVAGRSLHELKCCVQHYIVLFGIFHVVLLL